MAIVETTYTDLSSLIPQSSWGDVDIKSYVSANATGALLYVKQISPSTVAWEIGYRMNGSTDNRVRDLFSSGTDDESHVFILVGLDENKIFEAYNEFSSTNYIKTYLVGYVEGEATFFTNAYDESLGSTDTVTDIDISSETDTDTAIAAIFEIDVTSSDVDFWLRKNGSTDNFYNYGRGHAPFLYIVGVDESEICEGKVSSTNCDFYLSGYFTEGVTMNTNAEDISIVATETWTDVDVGAMGAFILCIRVSTGWSIWGHRRDGYTGGTMTHRAGIEHSFAMVPASTSYLIESYQGAGINACNFYLLGRFGEFITGTGVYINIDDEWLEIISSNTISSGDLKSDGTVALTADWDVGSHKITAETFESDVSTGTAPLTIASTTLVSNLNADYVDGIHGTDLLKKDGTVALTGDWDIGNGRMIQADKIRARDGDGLALYEDGGKGIFIQDSTGYAGIGTTNPQKVLHIVQGAGSLPVLGSQFMLLQNNANTTDNCILGILTGTSGIAGIHFGDTSSIVAGYIHYIHSTDSFLVHNPVVFDSNITIGGGGAGVDYVLKFDGESNDGIITWFEDEDYFKFSDDIMMNSTEYIYFRDGAIHIRSADDGHMDITADTSIDINGLMLTQNVQPLADNTYYIGKNDDDSPLAYKGVILKDTTNGKYYRIEIISGTITATDLTD